MTDNIAQKQIGLTPIHTACGFIVSAVAAETRPEWEELALSSGVPLALSDLEIWQTAGFCPQSTLFTIQDLSHKLVGGFAVQSFRSRALPGHRILHLAKLGEAIPEGAEDAVAAATTFLLKRSKRILRVDAEISDRDENRRKRIADALRNSKFKSLSHVRTYEHTLAIDLRRNDEELLASFSTRARREIRRARRFPLQILSVVDESQIPNLNAIHREAFERTGASAPKLPWKKLISSVRAHPDRMRIFGAMLTDESDATQLVAFALALRHGTSVVYETAGSTRLPNSRIPLMYPVIWELMRWARDTGANWFDFGGITGGSSTSGNDPVGGISEFKQNFGGDQLLVGQSLRYDAAPVRQRLIRVANRMISTLRQ